jgi:hypothetical protein
MTILLRHLKTMQMMQTKCSNVDPTSKTIRISFETYKDLAKLGTFGDSFDSVIRSLLLNHEKTVQEATQI